MYDRRWRKLEGSTPAAYEMLMKCQALQKRLIAATEACVEKDARIQEQEKVYLELKAILARQPGPEAALHISALQVPRPLDLFLCSKAVHKHHSLQNI